MEIMLGFVPSFLNLIWSHLQRVETALEVDADGSGKAVLDAVLKFLADARAVVDAVLKGEGGKSDRDLLVLTQSVEAKMREYQDALDLGNCCSQEIARRICQISRWLHVLSAILVVTAPASIARKLLTSSYETLEHAEIQLKGFEQFTLYRRNVFYRIESMKCFMRLIDGEETAFLAGMLGASKCLFVRN